MSPRLALRLGLVVLFALCSACSSFQARWNSAANSQTATRWDGRWTSAKHVTGAGAPMGGRLRAVMEPKPEGGLTTYFHANWTVFASDYEMTLNPKKAGQGPGAVHEFNGTHELPKMFGGLYRYEAQMIDDRFTARYTSSYDHGTFALQRLPMTKDYASAHARH